MFAGDDRTMRAQRGDISLRTDDDKLVRAVFAAVTILCEIDVHAIG